MCQALSKVLGIQSYVGRALVEEQPGKWERQMRRPWWAFRAVSAGSKLNRGCFGSTEEEVYPRAEVRQAEP